MSLKARFVFLLMKLTFHILLCLAKANHSFETLPLISSLLPLCFETVALRYTNVLKFQIDRLLLFGIYSHNNTVGSINFKYLQVVLIRQFPFGCVSWMNSVAQYRLQSPDHQALM